MRATGLSRRYAIRTGRTTGTENDIRAYFAACAVFLSYVCLLPYGPTLHSRLTGLNDRGRFATSPSNEAESNREQSHGETS